MLHYGRNAHEDPDKIMRSARYVQREASAGAGQGALRARGGRQLRALGACWGL